MQLSRAFVDMAYKEGIKARPHDLRHFHASMLFAQDENPVLVQQRLGHSSIATTANIYGHLMPGAQRRAILAFAAAMRPHRVETGGLCGSFIEPSS